jgi:NADH:ubiquinone reductase (H+-translocating)
VGNRIVILGGGVGGLSVARALRFVQHAEITLVERQPLPVLPSRLYAIAAGKRPNPHPKLRHVSHVQGEAVYLDACRQRLLFTDRAIPYDVLVVATGSQARYERDEWRHVAPALKTCEDAERIREKLRDGETTAVIAGGGVAGVELAATIARANKDRRVILAENGARLLAGFPEALAIDAQQQLQRLGVEVRYGLQAIGMGKESVRFSGAQGRERIASRAIFWTGGVEGSGFGAALRSETGVKLDEAGRVCVNPDLTVPGHPEIFVIGDLARSLYEGYPLDGLATVASQQGRYVASSIRERMAGYTPRAFEYVDQGRFALIGRGGIGMLNDEPLRGTTAWLAAKLAQRWSAPNPILQVPALKSEMRAFARW